MAELVRDEEQRAARLLEAQGMAAALFAAVEAGGLIAPSVGERQASDAIRAADMFGTDRWWHKRIVRAGPNTLQPYRENPPDRVMTADDIVFCDFGPIFEEWEADFGRTFVLGEDPVKIGLRDALPVVWAAGREWFQAHPEITGAQLFDRVVELSEAADAAGLRCHWILEVHLVDAGRQIGGFHEELLDIGPVSPA
jgi:Xaa-Pro aminopeptidase